MPTTYKKNFVNATEEELMNMTREEASLNLNEKQKRWCEVFVNNFNGKLAAKKAGYPVSSASTLSWRLRENPDVQLYLAWLKLRVCYKSWIRPEDILDQYARMAFADITDFVDVTNGRVKVEDSSKIDGQLVKSIKKGKDGITIEMYDKMSALSKLERFFSEMPKDWKQVLEEKKVSILEQRLELEKQKMGIGNEDDEDDGFLDALKGVAEEVWDDE